MENPAFLAYPLSFQSSVQVDQSTLWFHDLPAGLWLFRF